MKLESMLRVLSPNLGCPLIVSLQGHFVNDYWPLRFIVAAKPSDGDATSRELASLKLTLEPITEGWNGGIALEIAGPPRRIDDWNSLTQLQRIDDTRLLFNKILHYQVLGADTEYFEFHARIERKEMDRFKFDGSDRSGRPPILCDVRAEFGSEAKSITQQVNSHAVQLIDTFDRDFNFIHLTDLHIARRNDELLDEILHLSKEKRPKASPESIKKGFRNFNDHLRGFIHAANKMVDDRKLDFVVVSGDLVDFAYLGWEYESNYEENNWRTLINILTGAGSERYRKFQGRGNTPITGNPGLMVAAFTSTGNHDWRLFPYNPGQYDQWENFGLKQREFENFAFKSYDRLRQEKKRAQLVPEIASQQLDRWNLGVLEGEYELKLAQWVATETAKQGVAAVSGLLGFLGSETVISKQTVNQLVRWGAPVLIGGVVGLGVKLWFNDFIKRKVEFLMDNPLRAEPMALHHYLLHVNPFLDYAFTFGKHTFILMDTGPDVITGDLFDGKNLSDVKRLNINDNVLGRSPDSRAFDSEHLYYDWSQIIWLEKVLQLVPNLSTEGQSKPRSDSHDDSIGRTFVFLHSPPLNTEMIDGKVVSKLWDKNDAPQPVAKGVERLTFGTINHYVSEFLYMCLGYLESEMRQCEPHRKLAGVDIVFSGHGHRALEFRLELKPETKDKIAIYCNGYSEQAGDLPENWLKHNRPVLVQTPACGVPGKCHVKPPYFRSVKIDSNGSVRQFRVEHLSGPAPLNISCKKDMRTD